MWKRLERWGKLLLEAPLALLSPGPVPVVPPPAGAIRRVLIIRPDERIGNLVLLTPMIDAIHRVWPGAKVDVVAGGAMQGLFHGDPRIERIIVFDKRSLVRNPFGLVSIGRRIAGRYDLAIDASHGHHFSLTSGLLTRASRAPYRLGYFRGPARRLLNVGLEYSETSRTYTADLYVDLVRVLAKEATSSPLSLPLDAAERELGARLLAEAGARGGATIGIHPGGRGRKRWPVENWVELSLSLAGPGRQIILFHGPGEEDLVQSFPDALVVKLPRLSLRRAAAAMSRCDLFISGDTGPMHLAAALGVPTLALFLHANFDMFGPKGPDHRILFDPRGLEPAAVHEAALLVLERRNVKR